MSGCQAASGNKPHHESILTEVSALDGAVVKRYAQIVTRLAQLRNGDSIRAPDDPGFVVILPIIQFTEKDSECAMTCHFKRKCSKAIRGTGSCGRQWEYPAEGPTKMARNTVELIPSATSYSPFSLGLVKLCSLPEPNILEEAGFEFIVAIIFHSLLYRTNNYHYWTRFLP
jgi:hypothetical protein